jgi:hypothetical protein
MKNDVYVRIVLTIIAACLVTLVLRGGTWMSDARAAALTTCKGEMNATSAGPMQAALGASYRIEVRCE